MQPHPRKGKGTVVAAGAAVGLLALGIAWTCWSPREGSRRPETQAADAAPDPRLTFSTPYRNVHPDVKYVGDQACADCHADLFESYRQHPMGRALAPVAEATPIERYDEAAHNPFAASGLHYAVRRAGGRVFHREWAAGPDGQAVAEFEAEVHFAVGSGARARSYLVSYDGYLFESPATWYPHDGRWDLSPSFEVRNQHFSRPIVPDCLFCHCNQAESVPDTVNRYRPPIFQGHAIGCERCHGPGELHVRRRAGGNTGADPDDTIVNPGRLAPALREAVCQQCHLQGEQRVLCRGRALYDYRPGLPLHLFLMDFVNGAERRADFKFVNSVEQLAASLCYAASREPNKLGCISCHDPHRQPAPEEKVAHYRKRCLQCHTAQSCSLPPATRRETTKEDSCIVCHMPRTGSEVNHTAITDHGIPRRAGGPAGAGPGTRPKPGPADLVPFHADLIDLQDQEFSRNRGVALMAMLNLGPPSAVAREFAGAALPLLDRAAERTSHDAEAVGARGDALWSLGRRDEALTAFEAVLSQKPKSEITLRSAGFLALEMNLPGKARSYLEQAAGLNPWYWRYQHGLAVVSFRGGEWDRAVRECRQALRLEPPNTAPRSLLVQCYLATGQEEKARAEFETLSQLTPQERRKDLRGWFDEEVGRLLPQRRGLNRP